MWPPTHVGMRDVAGLTMLAVTAVIPVWLARAVLGAVVTQLTRNSPAHPANGPQEPPAPHRG
jgi:hypothetical protein